MRIFKSTVIRAFSVGLAVYAASISATAQDALSDVRIDLKTAHEQAISRVRGLSRCDRIGKKAIERLRESYIDVRVQHNAVLEEWVQSIAHGNIQDKAVPQKIRLSLQAAREFIVAADSYTLAVACAGRVGLGKELIWAIPFLKDFVDVFIAQSSFDTTPQQREALQQELFERMLPKWESIYVTPSIARACRLDSARMYNGKNGGDSMGCAPDRKP